jgi:cytochrome c oxidase cbb3-type subunit II
MNPLFRTLGFQFLAAGILLFSGLVLFGIPYLQLQEVGAPAALKPYSAEEAAGRERYVDLGCMYCHSQQPRDPLQSGADEARGWGRPSTPGDYYYDYPHQLGTMRTGPDLMNIGQRLPSKEWHLSHLYQPRSVVKGSIMPSFPFLFEAKDYALAGETLVNVPEAFRPKGKVIVAKKEALELVAYLISLDRTYPTNELPLKSRENTKEN